MIKSMTGYGVAGFENEHLAIQVEVRTLNSKMLDLSIRSPRQFADKESEIRNRAQAILDRGKVSISIDFLVKERRVEKKFAKKNKTLVTDRAADVGRMLPTVT